MAERPDPTAEIRLVSLRTLRGPSFWSRRPLTRLDLAVGAYDEISSADVPEVTGRLLRALPGLEEHRCSVGERGGFVARLRGGTYAPHIVEHVGLALQNEAGHDVGFGRARGGDREGEYTVVFGHLHAEVGARAAALALELVQEAFAGTLESAAHAVAELRRAAALPDLAPLRGSVACAVTGGSGRGALRRELERRGFTDGAAPVDLSPAYLLNVGLPFSRCEVAVILDADPRDVPARYREPDRALQLATVVVDAVPPGGMVALPARERELRARVEEAGRRVALFSGDDAAGAGEGVGWSARVRDGRIALERGGEASDAGPLLAGVPPAIQAAGALTARLLHEVGTQPEGRDAAVA